MLIKKEIQEKNSDEEELGRRFNTLFQAQFLNNNIPYQRIFEQNLGNLLLKNIYFRIMNASFSLKTEGS